jgi:hypothetical protein
MASNMSNQQISLRPAWYGKINWGDWRTINPKMIDYYERNKTVSITKYWGEFVSPSYDDTREYIKSIKQNNFSYSLDYYNQRQYENSRRQKNRYYRNRYKTNRYIDEFIDEHANEYVNEYITKQIVRDNNELENDLESEYNNELEEENLSDPDNYKEY